MYLYSTTEALIFNLKHDIFLVFKKNICSLSTTSHLHLKSSIELGTAALARHQGGRHGKVQEKLSVSLRTCGRSDLMNEDMLLI